MTKTHLSTLAHWRCRGRARTGSFLALCLRLLLICTVTSATGAPTVSLVPSADTTLIEVAPDNNAGGRGWISAGSNMNGLRNRALLKFELAANVPAGARIVGASLSLSVTGIPADGYAVAFFDLHRMLRDWGEGTNNPVSSPGLGTPATTNEATWSSPFALTANSWSAPGTAAGSDYDPAVTADQIIYSTLQSPYAFPDPTASPAPMIADLQTWLDYPATNFGWILICESEDVTSTARRFGSREDPNFPPALTVQYLVAPHIDQAQSAGGTFSLGFTALPGQGYTVQYLDSLATNSWQTLTNVVPPSQPIHAIVVDSVARPERFYRVWTY